MSMDAFRRTRAYLRHKRKQTWVSMIFGAFAGLLFPAWMVLLVLFVELALNQGEAHFFNDDARFASQLNGDDLPVAEFLKNDAGLLPVAVGTRHRWYGPMVAAVYRTQSWTHANLSFFVGLLVLALLIGVFRAGLLFIQNGATTAAVTRSISTLR